MKRRFILLNGVLASVSAAIFTSTGWLMGAKALTMPTPTPPNWPGQTVTGPYKITCNGCGCTGICQSDHYCGATTTNCLDIVRTWYRCICDNPPCSTGYCDYTAWESGLTCC